MSVNSSSNITGDANPAREAVNTRRVMNLWLWGTTINETVSAASQGHMYDRFDDMEKEKGAIPKPSPWVTIGNVATEVPLSAAGLPVTGAGADIEGIPGFDYDVLTQAPFRRNDRVDAEKEAIIEQKRPVWSSRIEFVIALMASVWTIDSLEFFTKRMIRHGGGAFLIPYFIFSLAFAFPTIIIELLIGQIFRRGVIVNMDRIHKFFSGVGKTIFIISFVKNIYFNTTTAWSLYYVVKEIRSAVDSGRTNPAAPDCEQRGWTGIELKCCQKSEPLFHWYYEFLHVSPAPFTGLDFTWYSNFETYWPFLVIAATWVLIGAILTSAFWFRGKLYYFTLIYPLLVLIFLFAKSLSTWYLDADYVDEPIAKLFELFNPKWEALLEPETWMHALIQALRGSLIGTGIYSTFAGYADRKQYLITDGILVFTWGMIIPVITSFLLIPVASYYPVVQSLENVKELPLDISIFYVIIPTVIESIETSLSGSLFASVAVALYFIALVALAFNSAIAAGEVIISTLMDVEFPNKIFPFKLPYKRTILSIMYATVSCVVGLVFGLQNGQYLYIITDQIIFPIPALFMACVQIFAVVWIYSIYRFNDDLWVKCGYQIPVLLQQYVTWILTPGLLGSFLAAVYFQVDRSILNPVTKSTEYVLTTSIGEDTGEATATNITTILRNVSYGYPALVDCEVSPVFREYIEWPVSIIVIQWLILLLFCLGPLLASLSYNAGARENWRIYKHKRKFPLGVIYPTDNRGKWKSSQAYVMAHSGAAIGVGIVSRFVYKYYHFGKYVFVIQCLIVQLLVTLPAFILDIDLGQIFRTGPITVWRKVHPIFSGLGYCCIFINIFLVAQYLFPTIHVANYIFQFIRVQFLGDYDTFGPLIDEAMTSDTVPRPSYLPVEKQHLYPWNFCIYQLCSISNEIDCNNITESHTLQELYEMVPNMCKYSPSIYQFQRSYLQFTENIESTSLMMSFFSEESRFANATEVFDKISQFVAKELDLEYIIVGGTILTICALITLTKPSVRQIFYGFLFHLPLLGLLAGSVYIALRGAANEDLVHLLFDLHVPAGVPLIEHIGEMFSKPESWANAGIVAITFNFVASGVNIALSSYNPRENWVNLQGIVVLLYTWLGNMIFLVFFFLNLSYMKLITNTWGKSLRYGLVDRIKLDMDAVMDMDSGGSYVFFAILVDSLSYHKHTVAVLPIMLVCIILLCFCPIQALIETISTSILGAGFFPFSRIPSSILAVLLCTVLAVMYTLRTGFGFFVYQIFQRFLYGWPVPLLGAIMVIASTWVYSMYRLNNAMFMYSMHHLSYYWMILWPFITPLGLLVLSGFTGYDQYTELLNGTLTYLGSQPSDYNLTSDQANNTDVMKIYLKEQEWPYSILYISSAINVLYLAPFVLTFLVIGLINCFKDFPCKSVCYEYYEDEDDSEAEDDLEAQDVIRTTLRSGNLTSNDEDNSLDAMSMEYSDVDNETNSTSSGEEVLNPIRDEPPADERLGTKKADKELRAHFKDVSGE